MRGTFDISISREGILVETSAAADRVDAVIINGTVEAVYHLVGCVSLAVLPFAQQLLQIFVDVVC